MVNVRRPYFSLFAISFLLSQFVFSQSTGSIGGTVTDAVGSLVPNATVTVRNQATGEEHATKTDVSGVYLVPSLPVGTYRVEVKSPGMQSMVATGIELPVGSSLRQDFSLKVATTTETVEVSGAAPLIDSSTSTLGTVVNQRTVQEIPLNGRHFIDLAMLTPGTVTPPANGFLTAPLRGQGMFAYNTSGAREDSFNPMINGINLSDGNQNQITFQPTINTVQEFKIDNQTFSAEYGRNSGSIVNIATRRVRTYGMAKPMSFFATTISTPGTLVTRACCSRRPRLCATSSGAMAAEPLKKDKTFIFLSYEGLRQRQYVSLSGLTLTAAQRAQIMATERPDHPELAAADPASKFRNQPVRSFGRGAREH